MELFLTVLSLLLLVGGGILYYNVIHKPRIRRRCEAGLETPCRACKWSYQWSTSREGTPCRRSLHGYRCGHPECPPNVQKLLKTIITNNSTGEKIHLNAPGVREKIQSSPRKMFSDSWDECDYFEHGRLSS